MTAPVRPDLLRRLDWSGSDARTRSAWIAGLRPAGPTVEVQPLVDAVRSGGDEAVRELTRRFDGVDLDDLWVPPEEISAALSDVPANLLAAIDDAIRAVRRYHADQRDALRAERVVRTRPGVTAWRRWVPLQRVGAYVPGGRAPLASSAIMTCLPARLAGVDEVVIASPPDRSSGSVAPAILAVAARLGVDRVLRVGGAQAIAALAYGTESVPAVDRIVGAGNAWVTAAKRLVSVDVAIDLPAGPSECVVLADADADPELVALDLLAQAEHGPDSVAVLVTDAPALLDAVERVLPDVAESLSTGERAMGTLARFGGAVLVASPADGVAVVDAVAPEHASLQCAGADALAASIRNAGAVFVGPWSAIAAGDYATGTNHVLPTGGVARALGGLSVEAFGHWVEVQRVAPSALATLAPTVAELAGAEGLAAHARSVTARAERVSASAAPDDPLPLLRRPEPIEAYPAEPSDDALAAALGLPVSEIGRFDMNTMPATEWGEYGDLAYDRLRAALSALTGVPGRRILPGAGADELIRFVTTSTVGPGDGVLVPTPTFAMFAVEARLAGARVVTVPRDEPSVRQSVERLRAAAEEESARLVWLCSPNNPTGDAYTLDEIRALADGLPALVVVDEVYLEFAEATVGAVPNSTSAASLQDELPNVIVLRSLSKAFGMAGVRIGYLVLPDALADRFDASRLPLSVSGPSERIALEALADPGPAATMRAEVIRERDRLSAALDDLGCEVLPSVTNFVTFRSPDAPTLADALERRGLILRRYDAGPIAGWLRATARPARENDRLITALREELA